MATNAKNKKYYLDREGVITLWQLINSRLAAFEAKIEAEYLRKPQIVTSLPNDIDAKPNVVYMLREDNSILDESITEDIPNALRALFVDRLPTYDTAKPNVVYFVPEDAAGNIEDPETTPLLKAVYRHQLPSLEEAKTNTLYIIPEKAGTSQEDLDLANLKAEFVDYLPAGKDAKFNTVYFIPEDNTPITDQLDNPDVVPAICDCDRIGEEQINAVFDD